MSLNTLTDPEAEPVTRAEAKAFARVETTDEDDLIDTLIVAAREHIEQATKRQLVRATFDVTLRAFPNGDEIIRLPRSPVSSVTHVKYRTSAGTLTTLVEDTDYLLDLNAEPATIEPVTNWPTEGDYPDAVQIRFVAGYAPGESGSPTDHAANVPSRAKVAIKALVAHWFEAREPVVIGAPVMKVPAHVDRLINGLRVWWND